VAISLDTYAIAACYLRDNTSLLTSDEVKLIEGWLRSRALKKLATCSSDPGFNNKSRDVLRFLMQLEAFFKKNSGFTDPKVAREAAINSFERGERLCRITNRRLDYYFMKRDRIDQDLQNVIEYAESFIQSTLGAVRPFLDELPELVKLTGGATASLKRRDSQPAFKIKRTTEMNLGTVPYFDALCNLHGYKAKMKVVTANRVEFVAKSWKTDRGIACEPTGSLPFQLAFDSYCKRRLRRRGVDLRFQDRNQDAAREGSISGLKATIDMSMASDTLAFNTVAWLLPRDWFNYVNAHRSPQYRLKGRLGFYAKFSSMGNGATFALETLVFLALARGCGDKDAIVYGDDVVIASQCAPLFYRALKFFGFIPNVEKSYTEGPFRESCGGNYYDGVDITPFYIRSVVPWDIPNVCHNLNGLQTICSPYGELFGYIERIVMDNRKVIPLVPYNADTMNGFHIHPHFAYKLKLLTYSKKYGPYILTFRGLVKKAKKTNIWDTRSRTLWYLRVYKRRLPGQDFFKAWLMCHLGAGRTPAFEDYYELQDCSSYDVPSEKFRRGVLRWEFPAVDGALKDIFYLSNSLATRMGCL
jgi:hypothetical protein